MPLRPGQRELYGDDWPAFSESIRFGRARGRCECEGECGSRHHPGSERCKASHGEPHPSTKSDVVLTVAHLDHEPTGREDVKAMCQACHLSYDRHHHARNAAVTRDEKAGQESLFPGLRKEPR